MRVQFLGDDVGLTLRWVLNFFHGVFSILGIILRFMASRTLTSWLNNICSLKQKTSTAKIDFFRFHHT
jgi:hypothetical protein